MKRAAATLGDRLNRWLMPQPQRRFARTCFAQEGEDMILRRAFGKRKHGFYVDVGAHHPFRFSNTYLLYKKGWRGINVDATPGSMRLFERYRAGDINLEAAVAEVDSSLVFYLFSDHALNTCDARQAEDAMREGARLIEQRRIDARPLKALLAQHLVGETTIDVMSVDVEGFDLQVLRSNDWTRYRPTLLLVERLGVRFPALLEDELYLYLKQQGYELYAKTVNTVFFRDRRSDAQLA
jgi:FkbM family methyltransferase